MFTGKRYVTPLGARRVKKMNWSDLTPKQKAQIEKEYIDGKEPGDIAPKFGLKPKQVSDQAYRKKWAKPDKPAGSSAKKKAAKKKAVKKAVKKKAVKKAVKKKAAKKKR